MSVAFTYAVVYQAEAVCRTPLRTGGTDGDTEQVLRGKDGRAFVQGSSLTGALRGWLEASQDSQLAEALFGSPKVGGHLIVSDALFDKEAEQYIRPRLKINPATAAGEDGKKFDMAHIGATAKLRFTLTWLGSPETAEHELPLVEQMLAAIDAGAIRLGAQKSNGFGQLDLTTVKKRAFDLTDAKDRQAWLNNELEGTPLSLPELFQSQQVVFTLEGHTDNLLAKTAPKYDKTPDGLRSYTPNLHEGKRVLLPGSSIKGAVRARTAYIAKVMELDGALVEQYFGREDWDTDNGIPGRVRFEDALLSGKKKKVSRIRIDRFTGGVFRSGLFTEEPVSSDLTLRITAPDEPEICGLLLYALRDLGLGLYNLGSGWAIGRGQVAVKNIQVTVPDGRRAALCSDGHGGMKLEDPLGLFQEWLERLEELRHEAW